MNAYELTCIIAKAKAYDSITQALIMSDTPAEGGKMTMAICIETQDALIELTKKVKEGE